MLLELPVGITSGVPERLSAGTAAVPVSGRESLISIVAFVIDAENAEMPTRATLPVALRAKKLLTFAAARSALGLTRAIPTLTPVTLRPIAPGVP